ncbi:MAG TPA: serine hydrolase domain-containing protein [Dermatophilaceae bacterium]|nr:serine hydrolase domain-containing protein [Dermatophilaceae bacterium]
MGAVERHWSPEQFVKLVPAPKDAPGTRFSYDNTNDVLLGLVVEAVTKSDLASVLRRDLWQPLGLERLALQDAQQLPAPLAQPGEDDEMPPGRRDLGYLPFRSVVSGLAAAGGAAGDAEAVARWGYGLSGAAVLRPSTVSQMTDFQDDDGYGLGTMDFTDRYWWKYNIDGFGHVGDLPGYRSVLAVIPARRISVAILSPSSTETVPYVQYLLKAGGLLAG